LLEKRLLGDDEDEDEKFLESEARRIFVQFALFSLYFSGCLCTVTTLTAVASAQLGPKIGAYNVAVLYGTMVFSSLFLSSAAVQRYGPKACLVLGTFSMSMYVTSFAVAVHDTRYAWPVVLVGAAIGGLGSGIMWTGQGVHFAQYSRQFATFKGISLEAASNSLGAVFASLYLGGEMAGKVQSINSTIYH
jgi:MFS family permease